MKLRAIGTFVLFFCLVSSGGSQDLVRFSVYAEPVEVRVGETTILWIKVKLSKGWHIYSTTTPDGGPFPTEIRLTGVEGILQEGSIIQPPAFKKYDPNFERLVEYYETEVRFGVRGKVTEKTLEGEIQLGGKIIYMLCNASVCLPPKTHVFSTPIKVIPGLPRSKYVSSLGPSSEVKPLYGLGSVADFGRALSEGSVAFLYLSFTMGFIALLSPCVFPMVPITVSFFTRRKTQTHIESIVRSFVYCVGIVSTFTGLGLLLAATWGASGASQFAANPWINLLIAATFVVFALNFFGLFEIRVPPGLLNWFNRLKGGGYGGILLMSFTFSVTSFTCIAPFVGTLLVLASQGTWAWPILGMLGFSTAFVFPFFFLSLFPQGLLALPKSGSWINSLRVVMGFLELAAAMKFLSNVDLVWNLHLFPRELFLAVWIAIFTLCGIYLLGKIRLPNDLPVESVGPFRLLSGLGCIVFCFYLLTGLFGANLGELDAFFPPYNSNLEGIDKNSTRNELSWRDDYEVALLEAKAQSRPIFVDFTGYVCTNCRWMEANIFTDSEIRALLVQYIRVQLFTDGIGKVYDHNRAFQGTRFGTVALPFYVIISSEGLEIARFSGLTRDRNLFKRFLNKGLSKEL